MPIDTHLADIGIVEETCDVLLLVAVTLTP